MENSGDFNVVLAHEEWYVVSLFSPAVQERSGLLIIYLLSTVVLKLLSHVLEALYVICNFLKNYDSISEIERWTLYRLCVFIIYQFIWLLILYFFWDLRISACFLEKKRREQEFRDHIKLCILSFVRILHFTWLWEIV